MSDVLFVGKSRSGLHLPTPEELLFGVVAADEGAQAMMDAIERGYPPSYSVGQRFDGAVFRLQRGARGVPWKQARPAMRVGERPYEPTPVIEGLAIIKNLDGMIHEGAEYPLMGTTKNVGGDTCIAKIVVCEGNLCLATVHCRRNVSKEAFDDHEHFGLPGFVSAN